MKAKITQFLTLFSFFVLGGAMALQACNLSQVGPNFTVTPGPGPDTTIAFQVCFGGGVTGTTNGANGDTRSIAFGWFDANPGFNVVSFLPLNITGASTGCTMPGNNFGAIPAAPYFTQGTVLYIDPGYYGIPPCVTTPFTCITSTAACGTVFQQCINFSFVVSQVPDSMRVFGVEGGGNAIAGCYPNADMLIIFNPVPVEWGPMQVVNKEVGVEVQWSTYQEANSDIFIVERELIDGEYEQIGRVNAAGNSSTLTSYEYVDHNPHVGTNRYRLVQVDKDGSGKHSQVLETTFEGAENFSIISVGPNPFQDVIKVAFFNPKEMQTVKASIIDIKGGLIDTRSVEAYQGGNALEFDLNALGKGIYFLRLESNSGTQYRKLIKH